MGLLQLRLLLWRTLLHNLLSTLWLVQRLWPTRLHLEDPLRLATTSSNPYSTSPRRFQWFLLACPASLTGSPYPSRSTSSSSRITLTFPSPPPCTFLSHYVLYGSPTTKPIAHEAQHMQKMTVTCIQFRSSVPNRVFRLSTTLPPAPSRALDILGVSVSVSRFIYYLGANIANIS